MKNNKGFVGIGIIIAIIAALIVGGGVVYYATNKSNQPSVNYTVQTIEESQMKNFVNQKTKVSFSYPASVPMLAWDDSKKFPILSQLSYSEMYIFYPKEIANEEVFHLQEKAKNSYVDISESELGEVVLVKGYGPSQDNSPSNPVYVGKNKIEGRVVGDPNKVIESVVDGKKYYSVFTVYYFGNWTLFWVYGGYDKNKFTDQKKTIDMLLNSIDY